jgi:hypothetical protein
MYYATGLPGWARYGGSYFPDAGNLPWAEQDGESERRFLRAQADALQRRLDVIRKRLEAIDEACHHVQRQNA